MEAGIGAKVEAQGWTRHGGQASRLGGLDQSRTPRLGTGEGKMESSGAKHRLWLPFGGVPPAGYPTAYCGDCCLVEHGLCDPTEWHRGWRQPQSPVSEPRRSPRLQEAELEPSCAERQDGEKDES